MNQGLRYYILFVSVAHNIVLGALNIDNPLPQRIYNLNRQCGIKEHGRECDKIGRLEGVFFNLFSGHFCGPGIFIVFLTLGLSRTNTIGLFNAELSRRKLD